MQTDNEAELKHLLRENLEVAKENNTLLRKLRRAALIDFWIRVIWIAILIGLPFVLYFYVLEPYFALFGSSYEQFRLGIEEIPGLKGLELMFPEGS